MRRFSAALDGPRRIQGLLVIALAFLMLRVWESQSIVGGYDSAIYWAGAKLFVHGHSPYAINSFVTPPSGLLVLAPFTLFKVHTAYTLFQIIAAASIVLAIRRLAVHSGLGADVSLLLGVVLASLIAPAFLTYGYGSLNGLILLSFVMALTSEDERWGGLWIGVSLALKPVLAPIAVVLLLQRRFKAVIVAAGVLLVTNGLAVAVSGTGKDFFSVVWPRLVHGLDKRFNFVDMSLQGLQIRNHWNQGLTDGLRALVIVVTIAVAVTVWRNACATEHWSLTAVRLVEVGSVLEVGTFLGGPFAWRYYLLFLVPLAFLVWARRTTKPMWLMTICAALLFVPDNYSIPFDRHVAHGFNSPRPAIGLALLLVAMGLSTKTTARDSPQA